MKLSGTARLTAPPTQVWAALNDPAVLQRTIPGCHALDEVGPDEYAMTVSAGVASIKGTYLGKVRISDRDEPTSYRMHASGSGGPGTVSADAAITLAADGDGTLVTYDADAVVGGVIAGVGQRVLAAVAKRTAGQFFAAVDAELRGERAPVTAAAPVPATGPIAPTTEARFAPIAVDSRAVVVGGVLGAAAALVGVLVGFRLGRR